MIFKQIEAVSEEKRERIKLLSAYSLPENPSERGLTPEQIKARFYRPIVDSSLSALAELGRVIVEVNGALSTLEALLGGESVGQEQEKTALEDLVWLSEQKQSLKAFCAQLEGMRQKADAIFLASEEAAEAREGAVIARAGAERARDDILATTVSSVVLPWTEVPSVKKTDAGGSSHLVFSIPASRPFCIARTFSSVAEMNGGAASDGVENGQYVMVDTGNVEDSENACLYFKQDGSYRFITDLSGAAGVTPVRGVDYFTPEDYAYFDAHIDERLGELDDSLYAILAIQEQLIGGGES